MDLALDANVLFSALIRQDTTFSLILHDDLHLYAPEFLLIELAKHKSVIVQKTGKAEEEFERVLSVLRRYIQFVSMDEFTSWLSEAERISPDPKDAAYLALALRMRIPVWSNDKDLRTKQDNIKVLSTNDLVRILDRHKTYA